MLAWLSKNIATIIICLVLVSAVFGYQFFQCKIADDTGNYDAQLKEARIKGCDCYGRLLPQRESAKGQKTQLISTTEQKKGRSANCVLLAYSGGFFHALLI